MSDNGVLKLDERLEFKIEFPGRTISCEGKVVWLKYFSDSGDKKAGIEFADLESKNREFIADFILDRKLHFVDSKI